MTEPYEKLFKSINRSIIFDEGVSEVDKWVKLGSEFNE